MRFFSEEERHLIREHRFKIQCLQMTLAQKGAGSTTYEGSGEIAQTPEGRLEATLFDKNGKLTLKEFFRSKPVGVLFEAEDYFTLEATDLEGNVWKADWVHVDVSSPSGSEGIVACGHIDELTATTEAPGRSQLRASCPANVRLPFNRRTTTVDTWATEVPGLGELNVRKVEPGLDICFESFGGTLPDCFETRLLEALSLVLGQPLDLLEFQLLSGEGLRTSIRASRGPKSCALLQPPIVNRPLLKEPGELLAKALGFFLDTPPHPDRYHPLAASIRRVLSASGGNIEDALLIAAVEMERVLRTWFEEKARVDDIGNQVAEAKRLVEEWHSPLKNRVLGFLQSLERPSPVAILRELESQGVLLRKHTQAWPKARNREAHGGSNSPEIDQMISELYLVYQGYLLLVFAIIGYNGRFSDLTQPNWPMVNQPRHPRGSAG